MENGRVVEDPPIDVGLAYWLACAHPRAGVVLQGTPRRGLWGVDLRAGWNLLALPTSPADWTSARVFIRSREYTFGDPTDACPVHPTALWYRDETSDLRNNGRWMPVVAGDTTAAVNPWGGYCVWSDSVATMVVRDTGRSASAVTKNLSVGAFAAAAAWTLDLSVASGNSGDAGVCVGVREGSRTGWDHMDVRRPPLPGGGVELGVVQEVRSRPSAGAADGRDAVSTDPNGASAPAAAESISAVFLQGFDAPGSDTYEWRLRISGEEPLAALTCVGLERLPAGWQVSLLNPDTGMAIDLSRAGSHRFVLGGEREFVLRAGARPPEGFSWNPTITGITKLAPNPSPGPIAVEYTVAQAARVRIDVFDVQGRRVSSLDEGARDAGRYSLTWSGARGAATNGGAAGAGVYFVRFQADGVVERRKVVLLR